jgi:hypothetical protein
MSACRCAGATDVHLSVVKYTTSQLCCINADIACISAVLGQMSLEPAAG